jgi:hypothetical protein
VGPLAMLNWFRAVLEQTLLPKARTNSNPELYAEVLLDNLPDGVTVADLLPLLERNTWWPDLQGLAPEVSRHPIWFRDFRAALIQMIKSPPPEEVEPPANGEPGVKGVPASDAAADGEGDDGE